jgi:hypothetical protein
MDIEKNAKTKYSFWDLGGKPTPMDKAMKLSSSYKQKRMKA